MRNCKPNLELDRLREEARFGIARHGMQSVAKAVGMSPGALRSLLDGASPRAKTVAKLRAWAAATTERDLTALITLLVEPLPESERERVARQCVELLSTEYRRAGVAFPEQVKRS